MDGGPAAGATLSGSAVLDGENVDVDAPLSLDEFGKGQLTLRLPSVWANGVGSLTALVDDGEVETRTATIPLILMNLKVRFFPEGGDLVAGVDNMVYVDVADVNYNPVDFRAQLVQRSKTLLDDTFVGPPFASLHEGRASFVFSPVLDEEYALRILSPGGVKGLFSLPPAQAAGVVLSAGKSLGVFAHDGPTMVTVAVVAAEACTEDVCAWMYSVRLAKKNATVLQETVRVDMTRGETRASKTVALNHTQQGATSSGVLTLTLFNAKNMLPLAERLVITHNPHNSNNLNNPNNPNDPNHPNRYSTTGPPAAPSTSVSASKGKGPEK